jgi:hypothetical protein
MELIIDKAREDTASARHIQRIRVATAVRNINIAEEKARVKREEQRMILDQPLCEPQEGPEENQYKILHLKERVPLPRPPKKNIFVRIYELFCK